MTRYRLTVAAYGFSLRKVMRQVSEKRTGEIVNREKFISIPPGIDSRIDGQRSLVFHEQNAVAGLTNRLLARLARVVRQVFPGSFYRQHKNLVSARADQ